MSLFDKLEKVTFKINKLNKKRVLLEEKSAQIIGEISRQTNTYLHIVRREDGEYDDCWSEDDLFVFRTIEDAENCVKILNHRKKKEIELCEKQTQKLQTNFGIEDDFSYNCNNYLNSRRYYTRPIKFEKVSIEHIERMAIFYAHRKTVTLILGIKKFRHSNFDINGKDVTTIIAKMIWNERPQTVDD